VQVPPQGVSNEMARFLRDEIDSVRELEMLLLLRSAGARATTPAALSAQLRSGVPWAEEQLSRMEAKGFVSVTRDGAGQRVFRYAPRARSQAETIDMVARLFETHRTSVIRLIFAEPRATDA